MGREVFCEDLRAVFFVFMGELRYPFACSLGLVCSILMSSSESSAQRPVSSPVSMIIPILTRTSLTTLRLRALHMRRICRFMPVSRVTSILLGESRFTDLALARGIPFPMKTPRRNESSTSLSYAWLVVTRYSFSIFCDGWASC